MRYGGERRKGFNEAFILLLRETLRLSWFFFGAKCLIISINIEILALFEH